MGYTPHILVIGGGATGTGVARDLAMRGLEVTLVESGRLASGATGSTDARLHSGAHYAEHDSDLARDCLDENRTLRTIADHCVENTGGLLVSLDSDDAEHFERKRRACEDIGIELRRLSPADAREREPALTTETARALRVPEATIDPFRLTVATANAAKNYGATIETHTDVTNLMVERGAIGRVEVATDDGTREIDTDYVVNVAGAEAGAITAMANINVPVQTVAGTMVVLAESPTDHVLDRCQPAVDGNLLVPHQGRCLVGTALRDTAAPRDSNGQEGVDSLLDELGAMVPELPDGRAIRSYQRVETRARAEDGTSSDSPKLTLFDHEERDGVWGMTTAVGGTLTTHRLAAERIADHVCAKFGIDRACQTAAEPLPGSESRADIDDAMRGFGLEAPVVEASRNRLGSRTSEVLETNAPNPVVCACEQVTRAEVRDAMADDTGANTDLDDVRIRTRAAMGECQGGRCCHTIATELFPVEEIETIDSALDTLAAGRWTGQRDCLWGDQLAEAMRNYERHVGDLNRDADHDSVDFTAFDSGPEWAEDDVNPRGGGFKP